MKIIFDPTGTQINNGALLVKLAIYAEPSEKSYHLTPVPIGPVPDGDIEEWIETALCTLVWNPVFYHFVTIDNLATPQMLSEFLADTLSPKVAYSIDEALTLPDRMHYLPELVKPFTKLSSRITTFADLGKLNKDFSPLSVCIYKSDTGIDLTPKSMAIGETDADLNNSLDRGSTYLMYGGPATGTGNGTITALAIRPVTAALQSATAGIHYLNPDLDTVTCRSAVAIGGVALDANPTPVTGLSLACNIGDIVGLCWAGSAGKMERSTTGAFNGYARYVGDANSVGDHTFADFDANDTLAITGTGTESGGGFVPYPFSRGAHGGLLWINGGLQ